MWSAVHQTTGAYLRVEDPSGRVSLYRLELVDGVVTVVQVGVGGRCAVRVDVIRDLIEFVQDVSDINTRAAVTWLEQTVDDQGQPGTTEHTVTVIDADLEAQYGTRRISVTTELQVEVEAVAVADRLMARLTESGCSAPPGSPSTTTTSTRPGHAPHTPRRHLKDRAPDPRHRPPAVSPAGTGAARLPRGRQIRLRRRPVGPGAQRVHAPAGRGQSVTWAGTRPHLDAWTRLRPRIDLVRRSRRRRPTTGGSSMTGTTTHGLAVPRPDRPPRPWRRRDQEPRHRHRRRPARPAVGHDHLRRLRPGETTRAAHRPVRRRHEQRRARDDPTPGRRPACVLSAIAIPDGENAPLMFTFDPNNSSLTQLVFQLLNAAGSVPDHIIGLSLIAYIQHGGATDPPRHRRRHRPGRGAAGGLSDFGPIVDQVRISHQSDVRSEPMNLRRPGTTRPQRTTTARSR